MHLFANAAVEKSCEAAPAPCVGHCQAAASQLKNEAEKLHGRHFDEHVPTCASKTKRVEDRNNRVRVEEGGRWRVRGGCGRGQSRNKPVRYLIKAHRKHLEKKKSVDGWR